MRAGPGLQAFPAGLQAYLGSLQAFLGRTKHKQHILFETYSAAYTKKALKVRNMHHIQLNHRSPAIAHSIHKPGQASTRPRFMQADAGFLNHVQARPAATSAGFQNGGRAA
jgi:hypothetical protein